MTKRHYYRITAPLRFICFIVIVMLIAIMAFGNISKVNIVHGSAATEYTTVTVESGDTLWSIAEEYAPENVDTRKVVYEIRKANNMDTSNINVGQEIKIPTSK